MANPFFTNLLDLISGNRARASEVESNLSAVEAGFDGVYEYLTRALRGPQAGGTIAEMPSAASRANKALVFDASGNPTVATPTDALNAVNRSGDTMTGPLSVQGNLLVTSASLLGYGSGAGGSVIQATSKSTTVTLNKPSGRVTTHNAALAAGAFVDFQISNSLVTTTDAVQAVIAAASSYKVETLFVTAGAFQLRLTNITGGSLSEAVSINFSIIKGVLS